MWRERATRHHRPDYILISAMLLLMGLGLIIIYSISPVLSHKILGEVSDNHFLFGQLLHVGVALTAFFVCSRIHYAHWQKLLPVLMIVTGFSLLLLFIPALAITKNGATRWIEVGPLSLQPSELMKLTVVILLASRFSTTLQMVLADSRRKLRIALAVLGVTAALVLFIQRDMGTAVVLSAIVLGQFFLSGATLKHVSYLAGIGLSVAIGSIILFPHRIARLVTYLDPAADTTSIGYHLNQSLIAIGSGGLLGLGVGKSVQVYGYLPEAANDSIFAIIGETFGFLGSVLILGLLALLIYRGLKVGLEAPNRFAQLLVMGIIIWLGTQTLVNVAAMLGLAPLTGIPLPFLSYGGTSLVVSAAALGIVVNISKFTEKGNYAQDSAIRGRNRRSSDTYSVPSPSPKTAR